MSEFGLDKVGPLEFNTNSMDEHAEFLAELMGAPIFDYPIDYSGLELSMGPISDSDLFFETNIDSDETMEPIPIIEKECDQVPFDEIEMSEMPPPIYVCNKEDSIQSPKTNGDILFNLILAISIEHNDHLKKSQSLLYKMLKDSRKEVMDMVETDIASENMVLCNIKYRELKIKRTSIVKILNLIPVQNLFGGKVLSTGTIQGIVAALLKKIEKDDINKIEYKNVPKKSFFIVRVKT